MRDEEKQRTREEQEEEGVGKGGRTETEERETCPSSPRSSALRSHRDKASSTEPVEISRYAVGLHRRKEKDGFHKPKNTDTQDK